MLFSAQLSSMPSGAHRLLKSSQDRQNCGDFEIWLQNLSINLTMPGVIGHDSIIIRGLLNLDQTDLLHIAQATGAMGIFTRPSKNRKQDGHRYRDNGEKLDKGKGAPPQPSRGNICVNMQPLSGVFDKRPYSARKTWAFSGNNRLNSM